MKRARKPRTPMRLYINKYRYTPLIMNLSMIAAVPIVVVIRTVLGGMQAVAGYLGGLGLVVMAGALFFLSDRRETVTIWLKPPLVSAYSRLGREYCTVRLDRPVYFYLFEYDVGPNFGPCGCFHKAEVRPFIALSNQPFLFHGVSRDNHGMSGDAAWHFMQIYDLGSIIVLPNDERTKPFLPVEKWIEVF